MNFSPRVHWLLVQAAERADVDRLAISDVWRLVGVEADRLGLTRPSYHSVRRIVREERERRRARRDALREAVDELWGYTGVDYLKLGRALSDTRPPRH